MTFLLAKMSYLAPILHQPSSNNLLNSRDRNEIVLLVSN